MRYMVIRTENLTKTYGRQAAVKNLTLDVEPGEIFGYLGAPGAGKTTTVRMFMDTIRPSAGCALILGMDTRRHSLEVRRKTGYLPAAFSGDPRATGMDLLRSMERLRGKVDHNHTLELARMFEARLDLPFGVLSPEEQQKIGIIQAFMHQPELVILDEPTRLLKDAARETFYRLAMAQRAAGRTIFITSGSLTEMERLCDRTAILHNGSLITVERGVQLRNRAMRRIEMRFANPVCTEDFAGLPNLEDLRMEDNTLRCTIHGDPDALIKAASQFRVTHFASQAPNLEEVFNQYYGVSQHAG